MKFNWFKPAKEHYNDISAIKLRLDQLESSAVACSNEFTRVNLRLAELEKNANEEISENKSGDVCFFITGVSRDNPVDILSYNILAKDIYDAIDQFHRERPNYIIKSLTRPFL